MFNDKTYDKLKWIAQYVLPGLGTLYFTLSSIWHLPYGEEVVGTISALDVFLGVLLGISSANYDPAADAIVHLTNKVDENGDTTLQYAFTPLESSEDLMKKEYILVKNAVTTGE